MRFLQIIDAVTACFAAERLRYFLREVTFYRRRQPEWYALLAYSVAGIDVTLCFAMPPRCF